MPEVYDNDSGIIARAVHGVLTADMGGGQSSLEVALAEMNAALTAKGDPYSLPSSPVRVDYGLGGAQLVNPEDCPEIRILVGGWQIKGTPSGIGNQGFDNHTFQVVSYLSNYEGAGDLSAEGVLALQCLDWEKVMVRAIRRRPDGGIWAHGSGSIGEVGRAAVRFQSMGDHPNKENMAVAARIIQTWRFGQDARY